MKISYNWLKEFIDDLPDSERLSTILTAVGLEVEKLEKFEEIISWKEARELNKIIGRMIEEKRFRYNYRLINQVEGSAGSIMDNIAEGFERGGNREFIQYLYIAKASGPN